MEPPCEGRMSEAPASIFITCAERGQTSSSKPRSKATAVKSNDDLTGGNITKTTRAKMLRERSLFRALFENAQDASPPWLVRQTLAREFPPRAGCGERRGSHWTPLLL